MNRLEAEESERLCEHIKALHKYVPDYQTWYSHKSAR